MITVLVNDNSTIQFFKYLFNKEKIKGVILETLDLKKISSPNILFIDTALISKYEQEISKFKYLIGISYLKEEQRETKLILDKLEFAELLQWPFSYEKVSNLIKVLLKKSQNQTKIISFTSPKGGTGQSTLITLFALYLQEILHKKVLLIDAQGNFNTLGVLLNIFPRHSLQNILSLIYLHHYEDILNYFEEHQSGLKLVPIINFNEKMEFSTQDHFISFIGDIKNNFDYILIDGPKEPSGLAIECFDASDFIYFILNNDIQAIRNYQVYLYKLNQAFLPKHKIKNILFNEIGRHIPNIKNIEHAVNIKINAVIQQSYELYNALIEQQYFDIINSNDFQKQLIVLHQLATTSAVEVNS